MRKLLHRFCPPILKGPLKGVFGSVRWHGDFQNWETASARCAGYEAPGIAQNVLEKTLSVISGAAAFERDGVGFSESNYNWPALACLLASVSSQTEPLGNVLDFGGSLGSFFFQHRSFLSGRKWEWHIVEQEHFVALGKSHLRVPELHFHNSIKECLEVTAPSFAMLSSVLQYLPNPWAILDEISAGPFSHLLVDRTPFAFRPEDRLTVQTVSGAICTSSYPCRYISHPAFLGRISTHWELRAEWDDEIDSTNLSGCEFRGMYFKRRHV